MRRNWLLSLNRTHLRLCAFCRVEPAQFFIPYIYISLFFPDPFFPRGDDETPNVGAQEEKQNGNRTEGKKKSEGRDEREREGKREGTDDYNRMPFRRHNAARKRAYFIMESHHIGYTITILIRHNGYLRFSRWDRKRANAWPVLRAQNLSDCDITVSFEEKIAKSVEIANRSFLIHRNANSRETRILISEIIFDVRNSFNIRI